MIKLFYEKEVDKLEESLQGIINNNTEKSKLDYYSTKNITPIASYENVVMKNKGTEPYEQLNSFVNKIGENKITDTLFDSPALYMYLSFILIGGIYLLTKSKDIFIVYLPNMLNILIVFFYIEILLILILLQRKHVFLFVLE